MGRTLPLAGDGNDGRDRTDGAPTPLTLLEACTSPQRRAVLETLCDEGRLTLDELAERVAARGHDSNEAVTGDEQEQVVIGLYHNHLQQLSEADIVEQTENGEETAVSLSSTVDPELIRELIEVGEPNWTALSAILGDERRQYATLALARADGDLSLEELTTAVAVQERGDSEGEASEFRTSVRISLHHVHLAKLSEAGVVSYDEERGLVKLDGLPDAFEADASEVPDAVPV